ncbi:MAG: hypothetical protein ABIE74_04235 [Pseudomonadota bacterium]
MRKRTITTLMAAMMLLITTVGHAAETIPPYIYFNAYVTDGGGNLLDDGPIDVIFRIYDINNVLLYSEKQAVNILNGKAVASIGAGVSLDTGAKMNGIPADVLKPSLDPRLEVEFVGYPAYGPDPFGAAPFSYYSQYAIGVMEGGVTASSIAKGAVEYDHLSANAKDELIDEITGGKDKSELVFQSDMVSFYRDPVQATMIGIRPTPAYGAGQNTLQGNMDSLDAAISTVRLETKQERDDRIAADTGLQTAITNETMARSTADSSLDTRVTAVEAGVVSPQQDLNMNGHAITNVTTVDGVDVSHPRGSVIELKSGDAQDNATVNPPTGFTASDCKVVASFKEQTETVAGVDRMCVKATQSGGGFLIRCLYDSDDGPGGPTCDGDQYYGPGMISDYSKVPQQGSAVRPCNASYIMMCAK